MGTRSELCHRSQILLFLWRQSVEAYTKETFIQCGDRFDGGRLNILKRDWTCFCDVPGMLAPLLKEVGVASGLLNDLNSRFRNVVSPLFTCGLDDR
jgi:hypothetical protein